MMSARVTADHEFRSDRPIVLFEKRFDTLSWNANYDVTPDGARFLMVQPTIAVPSNEINVVLNWTEELKRLVPTR